MGRSWLVVVGVILAVASAMVGAGPALAQTYTVTAATTQVLPRQTCDLQTGVRSFAFAGQNTDWYANRISVSVTYGGRTQDVAFAPNPLPPGARGEARLAVPAEGIKGTYEVKVTPEGDLPPTVGGHASGGAFEVYPCQPLHPPTSAAASSPPPPGPDGRAAPAPPPANRPTPTANQGPPPTTVPVTAPGRGPAAPVGAASAADGPSGTGVAAPVVAADDHDVDIAAAPAASVGMRQVAAERAGPTPLAVGGGFLVVVAGTGAAVVVLRRRGARDVSPPGTGARPPR